MFKKILLLTVVMFAVLIGSYEAKAQGPCPSGFILRTVILTVQDCDYNVQICYQCNATNNSMTVSVVSFGKVVLSCVQNPPMTASEILGDIYAQLNDPDYIEQLCGDIPPCDGPGSGVLDYYERRPNCWRKYNNNGNIVNEVCPDMEDIYCESHYTWCYDLTIPEYRLTLIGTTQYGDPNCPSDFEPDPKLGEYSDCFYIKTDCDDNQY